MKDFTVLDMPIEPIPDRYSEQWTRWFKDAYSRNGLVYFQVKGDCTVSYMSAPGQFLNPSKTFYWKHLQLEQARIYLENIQAKNTVVAFLHDAWYPGIEALRYICEMKGINLKIVGFWHAGSYLSNDMLGIKGFHSWARGSEQTWFALCDAVCVGSEYHKNRILSALAQKDTDADKVYVTGYPIDIPDRINLMDETPRENIVVWPHRIAEDKHPEIFEMLAHEGFKDDWRFIRSKDVCETKNEYYRLLARSKICVSTATMETFGISMIEAACLGCHCLVPDALCYPEFFHSHDLYGSYKELKSLVNSSMAFWDTDKSEYNHQEFLRDRAIDCWFEHCQECVTDEICEIIEQVANG